MKSVCRVALLATVAAVTAAPSFALPQGALAESREVLRSCGNMSSATILFVLEKIMPRRPATGVAMAFGPGLAMEGFRFGWTDAC